MRKLKQHSGFTLLEILVAITVLSIGFLGMAGLTTGIIRGNYFSKNVTSATVLAQAQLEQVQRRGYAGTVAANFPNDNPQMGGVAFARTTNIADNTPTANARTVTVTVSWNNGANSVSLNTIIAQ